MSEWKVFGKPAKGTAIHFALQINGAMAATDFVARCDKSISVVEDKKLTVIDVTCKKCQRYKDYIDAVKATDPEIPAVVREDVEKPKAKAKAKPKAKPVAKKAKPKPKAKPKVEEKKPEEQKTDIFPTATVSKAKKKKPIPKSIKEIKQPEEKVVKAEFFIDKKKPKAKTCGIVHTRTGIQFFDHVPEEVATLACENLNNITSIWMKKEDNQPANFISACRKAVAKAFEALGLPLPTTIKEKKKIRRRKPAPPKKPARVIKRREKKEKPKEVRVIRRRGTREKIIAKMGKKREIKRRPEKLYGMNIKRPTGYTANLIKEGNIVSEMIEDLKATFDFNEKRALREIRGIVRKIARVKKVKIKVYLGGSEIEDYYEVMED